MIPYVIAGIVATAMLSAHAGGRMSLHEWVTLVLLWPVTIVPYFTLVLIDHIREDLSD